MQDIYADEGLVESLLRIAQGTVRYHLFVNDITPTRDTELADLVEAAWTGYTSFDLDETDFTSTGVAGHTGYMQADPLAFENADGGDVDAFGYYVTDASETLLFKAARFDAAPITKPDGDFFVVTPTWGDFSLFT